LKTVNFNTEDELRREDGSMHNSKNDDPKEEMTLFQKKRKKEERTHNDRHYPIYGSRVSPGVA
jgi:hypothetical protein